MVCLSCTATGERVCLAAEGFGNRHCFLENIADKNIPPDLSQCVFVIEQALSVRALQELVTAAASESVSQFWDFCTNCIPNQSRYMCTIRFIFLVLRIHLFYSLKFLKFHEICNILVSLFIIHHFNEFSLQENSSVVSKEFKQKM